MDEIEIETGANPDAAVIWLHGLGADGHDFEPIVPELRLPAALRLRFVFPHAPIQPVTINGGMRMRAWYDILQLGGGPEDEKGIRASQGLLGKLIEREKSRGIPASRIVLAGFSQGGAIVLQAALRYPERLAGVLALSTYLPLAAKLAEERHAANAALPIFMAHGSYDDIIPLARAERSRELLEAAGYRVQWHAYPMPHSVCAPEIADLSRFLQDIL
ncbi:MAG: dienelactone hydrolase family protein [Betaproteobacteria bacterium]|nr:dienelactone hydrolase family protein [Betaproteobacteria bacterium]